MSKKKLFMKQFSVILYHNMEKENTIMLEENKDDLQKCAASDLSKVSVDIYKQDIEKNEDPESQLLLCVEDNFKTNLLFEATKHI